MKEILEFDFEEWRPVKDFEGLYEVSNYGRIMSLERIDCLGHKRKKKLLKGSYTSDGYLRFEFKYNGVKKKETIQRTMYEAFIGNIPKGYDVHHKNHDKTDNRIENLELITKEEHGKLHYEEKKDKMNNAVKLKYSKRVRCVETGVIYPSTHEIERELGFFHQAIIQCCKGKIKQAYGYHWEYVD